MDLPAALQPTESWWVLGTCGALALAEFLADKILAVDWVWDLPLPLAGIPAGAFLAAATLSPDGQLGAGALAAGAGVALTSHVLKSGTRALLNTSPEPASNWLASATEYVAVTGGLALLVAHPLLAAAFVLGLGLAIAGATWWLWRAFARGMRRLAAPPGA